MLLAPGEGETGLFGNTHPGRGKVLFPFTASTHSCRMCPLELDLKGVPLSLFEIPILDLKNLAVGIKQQLFRTVRWEQLRGSRKSS